jgi:hypothetical protein
MDITAIQDPSTLNIEIIFYQYPGEFKILDGEYPFISKLQIFGLDKRPIRIYHSFKSEGKSAINDIPQKSIIMNSDTKAVYVSDLKLPLETDLPYKIILETTTGNENP